jgi:hypothetical protein
MSSRRDFIRKMATTPWQTRALMTAVVFSLTIPTSPAAAPWTFMVYGDTRAHLPWEEINQQIVSELVAETVRLRPDFVVVPGDLVYFGSRSAFELWRAAMAPVYEAGIGVYPVAGNHDAPDMASWIDLLGPGIPDNGPAGQVDRTYFVQNKNALLLAFDQFAGPGYYDAAWLEAVLQTNTAPHVFATGHLPAFKVVHYDLLDDDPIQRDAFWRTLAGAGCRAYFCGHDHFYDHLRADDGDGSLGNDMHQLIVGTGGATLYGDGIYDGFNEPWLPVRVYHEDNFGYVLVQIEDLNATATWHRRVAEGVYEASEDTWSYVTEHQPALRMHKAVGPIISFTARAGMEYVLERSEDLINWAPVTTNTVAGPFQWPVAASGSTCGMFRVRQRR